MIILWLFLSGGMLMPATIPQSVLDAARTPDIQEAVARGWDLQVRGRVREHLEWFTDTYMEPGTYSAVVDSASRDYQTRFYTSREDFADALARAAHDIDYTKFKDTSLRYPWGQKYHDLLLRVWGASAAVFGAGGPYAPRSKDNPNGYDKAKKFRKRGNPRKNWRDEDWGRYDRPVGSTFFDDLEDDVDDVPLWVSRSIHDMTNEELEELEARF